MINKDLRRLVYFVRHGERDDLLRAEKLSSQRDDADSNEGDGGENEDLGVQIDVRNTLLSDLGKSQSFLTGMSIAKGLKAEVKADAKILIMSSPYLRCIQTAFQIMVGMRIENINVSDTTIFYTDFLKEYQNERNSMKKEDLLAEFRNLNLPVAVSISPGGDQLPIEITRESQGQSFARTKVFLDKLTNPNLQIDGIKPDVIICVTHSFFFINLYFMHSMIMEAYGLIEYCSYTRVAINEKGNTKLDIINRHQHLDKLNLIQKL